MIKKFTSPKKLSFAFFILTYRTFLAKQSKPFGVVISKIATTDDRQKEKEK
jgi:hypothetical protein